MWNRAAVFVLAASLAGSGCMVIGGTFGAIADGGSSPKKRRVARAPAPAPEAPAPIALQSHDEMPPGWPMPRPPRPSPPPPEPRDEDEGMSAAGKGFIAGLVIDAAVVGGFILFMSQVDFTWGGDH